jgi:hypothetical protein
MHQISDDNCWGREARRIQWISVSGKGKTNARSRPYLPPTTHAQAARTLHVVERGEHAVRRKGTHSCCLEISWHCQFVIGNFLAMSARYTAACTFVIAAGWNPVEALHMIGLVSFCMRLIDHTDLFLTDTAWKGIARWMFFPRRRRWGLINGLYTLPKSKWFIHIVFTNFYVSCIIYVHVHEISVSQLEIISKV